MKVQADTSFPQTFGGCCFVKLSLVQGFLPQSLCSSHAFSKAFFFTLLQGIKILSQHPETLLL